MARTSSSAQADPYQEKILCVAHVMTASGEHGARPDTAAPFGGVARDLDVVAGEPRPNWPPCQQPNTPDSLRFCSRCAPGRGPRPRLPALPIRRRAWSEPPLPWPRSPANARLQQIRDLLATQIGRFSAARRSAAAGRSVRTVISNLARRGGRECARDWRSPIEARRCGRARSANTRRLICRACSRQPGRSRTEAHRPCSPMRDMCRPGGFIYPREP